MKPVNNWNNVRPIEDRPKLPAGGYVCKIMGAEVKTYSGANGDFEKLEISLDIYEGEYNGFFADDYRAQQREDKKWGCIYRLYVPTDDGSEKDEFTKRKLRSFTDAVEASSAGYHWDWNEAGLKGKEVGMIFRNEEWEWNDKSGWKTQPFIPKPADDIREGKFKIPEDKPLSSSNNGYTAPVTPSGNVLDEDDDLPF